MSKRTNRTKFNEADSFIYYLNQSGSRAVRIDRNGNRETIPVSWDGVTVKQVAVKYWEQCGNFAMPYVRKGNKLVAVYADSDVEVTKYMPYEHCPHRPLKK